MNDKLVKRIIKEGIIPIKALQVLSYIATENKPSTTDLEKLTNLHRATLNRYIKILEDANYIVIDSDFRPFTYSLSEKGKKIWEGK